MQVLWLVGDWLICPRTAVAGSNSDHIESGDIPTTIATLRAGAGNNGIATDETPVYWTQGSTLMRAVK